MPRNTENLLAMLGSGLVGALGGAGLMVLLADDPQAPPNASPSGGAAPADASPTAADPALLEELRALRSELGGLGAALMAAAEPRVVREAAAPAAGAHAPPADSGLPPELSRDLTQALRDLSSELSRSRTSHGSNLPQPARVANAFDGRQALSALRALSPGTLELTDAQFVAADQDLRKRHFGWTTNQLAEAYGMPEEVWFRDNGISGWHYLVEYEPDVFEAYTFESKDGQVYSAELDYWIEDEDE